MAAPGVGSAHPENFLKAYEIRFSIGAKSVVGWAEPTREEISDAASNPEEGREGLRWVLGEIYICSLCIQSL